MKVSVFQITLLVYSVVVKLVPCLLITLLIPAIIRGMWVAKRHRQRLLLRGHNCTPTAVTVVTAATAVPATCQSTLLTGSTEVAQQNSVKLPNRTINTTAEPTAKTTNRDTVSHFTSLLG